MAKINKRKIAGLLVTCMVSTMLSPVMPVYALEYGDSVTMMFNTGDGPDVSLHDPTWGLLTPGQDTDGSTLAMLSGQSGYLLTDPTNTVSSRLRPLEEPQEQLLRPQLPDWSGPNSVRLDSSWDGYRFDGWYTAAGTKLERLYPAFPQEDVTYYAKWTGNPDTQYDFGVKHYADATINGVTKEIEFYAAGLVRTTAGTTVSTSYKRTVPGYKFEGAGLGTDYDYQPRNARKYGERAGAGTGKNVGGFNSSYAFSGTMPNDKLLVDYRYVPDPEQKFNFRVEHLNASATAIATAQVTQKSVGESIAAAPVSVGGYVVSGVQITVGDSDNLAGNGTYGATYAGGSFSGNTFAGVMPNQAVTITYTYAIVTRAEPGLTITIYYVDDQGRDLLAAKVVNALHQYGPLQPRGTLTIPAPDLTNYGYKSGVILRTDNLTSAVYVPGNHHVEMQAGIGDGSLTIVYTINLDDPDHWVDLTFLSGSHGKLEGNVSSKILARGTTYMINADGTTDPDFTAGFTPIPDYGYMKDGWYRVNSSGEAMGSKLTEITLTDDTKLMFCFQEDPADWVDIGFASGGHGTVSSSAMQHLLLGTTWRSGGVLIPSATANNGYMFAGWYDEQGTLAWDGKNSPPEMPFVTGTYTAKFVPIVPEIGYDAMNRPDAQGSLASDGSGVITVSNSSDNRRYIVTDMEGTVLAELTTSQVRSGSVFDDLTPGSSYYVYEISVSAPSLTAGTSTITDVTSEFRSYPARVILPAVHNNAAVENDPNDSEKARIVIRPAADHTVYALLDEAGSEVYDWTTPSGNPPTVIFDDLDPDTYYMVVAKDVAGTESPEDKMDYRTDIYTAIDIAVKQRYLFRVLGGSIERIDGETAGDSEYSVKVGVEVEITAPETDASGQHFKQWKALVGTPSNFTHPDQRTKTVTMPAKNVLLAAIYDAPQASPSSASLDYKVNSGHEGEVALDMSSDKLSVYREALTTEEDQELLNVGRTVSYRIQFTKHSTPATESNAVKAERGEYDDAFRAAFALDVKLLRFVDGQSRPVAADSDPGPIDIFLQINTKDLGHLDYQLWQIDADGQVDEITPLVPDPYTASDYGGLFMFTGEIGNLYVLSYSKTSDVTLRDGIAGNHEVCKVRYGEGLIDSDRYKLWNPMRYFIDSHGLHWTYIGLSTRSGSYEEFDDTDPIKKNKTIYTYYESDQAAWDQIGDQLIEEIKTANDLMNNGNVSQEDKDRLQAVINEVEAVLNHFPRSTIDEVREAYEKLNDIVESIRNFHPPEDPDDPDDPDDPTDPDDPKDPGKSNNGGGDGSSSSGSSVKRSITYRDGTDGSWQLIDAENHRWAFILASGSRVADQWVIIESVHEGTVISYYYHFDADGVMNHGWFQDTDGRWYYLDMDTARWFGHMKTGWHLDPQDQSWYYLDPDSGAMATGWKKLGDQWYYFNEDKGQTWGYNDASAQWEYLGTEERPYGAMYVQETTPDGHYVNGDGVRTD